MAESILMPRLSDTMTEGVIAAWHKKVGDPVKKGDLLAEVETDKATMELESYKDGTLLHLGADKGQKLQVNDLLAIIGKPGEDISTLVKNPGAGSEPQKQGQPAQQPKPAAQPTSPAPAAEKAPSVDISKMEEVILMPRLSDTMTEGVIAGWHKNVGDPVKKGDVLADIETDKATMELESYKEGKLLYQGAKQGDKIAVNELLAIIGKDGLDVDAIVKGIKGGKADAGTLTATKTKTDEQKAEGDVAPENKEVSQAEKQGGQAAPQPAMQQEVVNEGRIFASPLAKKLAQDKGIDLRYVKGSGDNGRITKTDIENYKAPAQPQVAPQAETQPAPTPSAPAGQVSFEDVPV